MELGHKPHLIQHRGLYRPIGVWFWLFYEWDLVSMVILRWYGPKWLMETKNNNNYSLEHPGSHWSKHTFNLTVLWFMKQKGVRTYETDPKQLIMIY